MDLRGDKADRGRPACSSSLFTEDAFSDEESARGARAVEKARIRFLPDSCLYNVVMEGDFSSLEELLDCWAT